MFIFVCEQDMQAHGVDYDETDANETDYQVSDNQLQLQNLAKNDYIFRNPLNDREQFSLVFHAIYSVHVPFISVVVYPYTFL